MTILTILVSFGLGALAAVVVLSIVAGGKIQDGERRIAGLEKNLRLAHEAGAKVSQELEMSKQVLEAIADSARCRRDLLERIANLSGTYRTEEEGGEDA
jgi:hypothetical protein